MAAESLSSTTREMDSALKLDTNLDLNELGHRSVALPERQPDMSSDDESAETGEIPAEDARTAIGVSIGRKQTWLTSPQTPAIEKAAAMEEAGGFWSNFDGIKDPIVEEGDEMDEEEEEPVEEGAGDEDEDTMSEEEEQEGRSEPSIPPRSPQQSEEKLPSPWRVDPKGPWTTGERTRSGIFDGIFNRLRSSSNPDTTTEGSHKSSFRSSISSKSKHFSISSQSPSSNEVGTSSSPTTTSSTAHTRPRSGSDSGVPEFSQIGAISRPEGEPDESRRGSVQSGHSRVGILRRSTSDHSLTMNRVTRTETLGDDSRFTDVHNQVNSRLQAIKDSWQDANIRISGLSNIKVSNFTPDFLKERSSIYNRRGTVRSVSVETTTVVATHHPAKPIDPMTRQPYSSAREAMHDAPTPKHLKHPNFTRALEKLEGDLVVLGGYRGSILRSAEPPHRQVWVPIKVGLNIRKVNLEVGFEEGDDEAATDHIIPDGMLTHIGPVDISRRLFKRFRQCENTRSGKLTVHDYGYDWRLSPLHLSKVLIQFLEKLPCNQEGVPKEKRGATVIAHSLGGLITRHAVNQRPELFRGVVYAGVPQTCVNILGPLRNGDEVLISQRVLTAQVNFSIRTSFALLPLDGRCFIDAETNEEYPVDFFDINTWIDLRLSPCVNRPLPPLQPPPKPTGITAYVNSISHALPALPLRHRKDSTKSNGNGAKITTVQGAASANMNTAQKSASSLEMSMDDNDPAYSVRTACTIPREKAIEYLDRTLKSVKKFKQELAFNPTHAEGNVYPPIALIYGKSTPTVYGAKVNGREGIKHSDAYDNLAFASGDGVVLARAAQAPEGYKPARGGVVSSQRGHVTLLGDLEAVGRCLNAVRRSREKGIGLG